MVWYASYGSNLCAERFGCYIRGGTPRGATRPCRGARDTTPPRQDRALEIPYRLYFAGASKTWGGSPCFLDTVESPATPARARAYLITWEQFEDVVAQENGRRVTSPIVLAPDDLAVGRSHPLGSGRYENLLCVGRESGAPVLTFTSPWAMAQAELGAPAPNYLAVLIDGLRESHKMRDGEITTYLRLAPGCSEELVAAALALAL
jgi:hypothetical protein